MKLTPLFLKISNTYLCASARGAVLLCMVIFSACSHGGGAIQPPEQIVASPEERHLKNLRQLTFEGSNAEAYFSPDGAKLIYQGHGIDSECDQVYVMNVDGSEKQRVSTGGRNTCAYFLDPKTVLFSSTFASGLDCPAGRDKTKGYVWDIFKSYEVYTQTLGDDSTRRPLTTSEGYDAESTVCGEKIVFTSARSGKSLDIFTMRKDGTGVKQLTHRLGYSGGPVYSPDCRRIVFRAHYPDSKPEQKAFSAAIAEGYIPQGNLEVYVMNENGSGTTQLTNLKTSSFAPTFYPDGKKVLFSANPDHTRTFHLWAVDAKKSKQKHPEQITHAGTFNGFPMFSPDGKHVVFASNRNSKNPRELQIFIAEWVK